MTTTNINADATTATPEVKTLTIEEQLDAIKVLIKSANDALSDDKNPKDFVEDCEKAVEKLNSDLRTIEYAKWLKEDKPMFTALKQGDIKQKRLKHVQPSEKKAECYELAEFDKLVDVIEFNDYAKETEKKNLFPRGSWIHEIEIFTKYLAMRIASDLENNQDIKNNFKMSASAQSSDYKVASPTSNKSLKTVAQYLVDGIIFEPTEKDKDKNVFIFENKDLKFILLAMTRKGKSRASLSMPRVSTITDLLTETMHRIVTKKEYVIE